MKAKRSVVRMLFTLMVLSILTAPGYAQGKDEAGGRGYAPAEEQGEVEKASGHENTPVIMVMNGTEVRATLNNTLTAREFAELLPYSVTVSRATDDLCGSVSEKLPSDPSEGKDSWKIGEIGWFGGWFTILVDHEERFAQMPGVMIIGKVDEEDLDKVTTLTGRVEITVRAE